MDTLAALPAPAASFSDVGDRAAVMSMRPNRAAAVLSGDKKIEIRRRRLAPDVRRVAMYAVRPVQMIVGEFAVEQCVTASSFEIWELFKADLQDSPQWFAQYVANADRVTAIVIGDSKRYEKHLPLSLISPDGRPPQSFYYRTARQIDDALMRIGGNQMQVRSALEVAR